MFVAVVGGGGVGVEVVEGDVFTGEKIGVVVGCMREL